MIFIPNSQRLHLYPFRSICYIVFLTWVFALSPVILLPCHVYYPALLEMNSRVRGKADIRAFHQPVGDILYVEMTGE